MSYLAELSDLVMLHAHAQDMDIKRCRNILGRINRLEGESPGSWGIEWMTTANDLQATGRHGEAWQYFNLARFPYPTNQQMIAAHKACVDSFLKWIRTILPEVERRELYYCDTHIPFYFYPSMDKKAPLLLVMGGIVSLKEQWGQFLLAGKKMGFSVIVAEMPGVGENRLCYDQRAYIWLSRLIDNVQDRVESGYVHAVMMSFSGNLALRQAVNDQRIRAITTVGAPVAAFFSNREWWDKVPLTTKNTLAYLFRQPDEDIFPLLAPFAIAESELNALDIPLYYVQSLQDEIISSEEVDILKRNMSKVFIKEFDDVHGSPNYMSTLKKYIPWTILHASGKKKVIRFILGSVLLAIQHKRK